MRDATGPRAELFLRALRGRADTLNLIGDPAAALADHGRTLDHVRRSSGPRDRRAREIEFDRINIRLRLGQDYDGLLERTRRLLTGLRGRPEPPGAISAPMVHLRSR